MKIKKIDVDHCCHISELKIQNIVSSRVLVGIDGFTDLKTVGIYSHMYDSITFLVIKLEQITKTPVYSHSRLLYYIINILVIG